MFPPLDFCFLFSIFVLIYLFNPFYLGIYWLVHAFLKWNEPKDARTVTLWYIHTMLGFTETKGPEVSMAECPELRLCRGTALQLGILALWWSVWPLQDSVGRFRAVRTWGCLMSLCMRLHGSLPELCPRGMGLRSALFSLSVKGLPWGAISEQDRILSFYSTQKSQSMGPAGWLSR